MDNLPTTNSRTSWTVLSEIFGPAIPWNLTTWIALLALGVLWAVKVYSTWAAWGSLTMDSGHEMYVPALLAEGKTLYRDTWFMYGPAAPYFNSYLFRLFGIHLNVLYWAGSLSALGSAILLYVIGTRLSSRVAGWTAGAVVLLEAFQPSLFCFPLPYSFASVYGCLLGCLFLLLAIRAANSTNWWWMLVAGTLAGVELLTKPEFGMACYGTLGFLIVMRALQQHSASSILKDLAATLPGIAICVAVIRWMVSLEGVEFITQENIVSWPTSYFMRTYGKMWLQRNGFALTTEAFGSAFRRFLDFGLILLLVYSLVWWKPKNRRTILLRVLLSVLTTMFFCVRVLLVSQSASPSEDFLATFFFPTDMVLYVCASFLVAWWVWWASRRKFCREINPGVPILLTYSSLTAFRILMMMTPDGYAIYYNGPVVLCFLLLMRLLIPRKGHSQRYVFLGELLICLGCLSVVAIHTAREEKVAKEFVPLVTPRGTVRVGRTQRDNYSAAIQFMKEQASQGKSVLSVPEDTSLYFLSETYCPIRVYLFVPGIVAPGKMTNEVIREIDRKPVDYLLWSNRTFFEFGVPVFGKHFDQALGDYLKSHYRPSGSLRLSPPNYWEWTAVVWERIPEKESN